MTQQQYQELIQAYGISSARWPEHLRADGAAFAARHPKQAAVIDAKEGFIDHILDKPQYVSADNTLLMARILKTAAATPQLGIASNDATLARARLPALNSRWKTLAAVLLVMGSIGFTIGGSNALSGYNTAEALLALNDASNSNHWSEILP